MTNAVGKINIASLKVLKTLLCLFNQDLTMEELVAKLNLEGLGSFNNFVASKYINTCKACGIDIQKFNNKYKIINFPIGIKLTEDECELLYEIKEYSMYLKSEKKIDIVQKFMNKLHMNFYKINNGITSNFNYKKIKTFEKAYLAKCEIQLILRDGTVYNCFPQNINMIDKKIIFTVCCKGENIEIKPDEIKNIYFLSDYEDTKEEMTTVLFELYGSLANSYQLRENEQIIHVKNDGTIVIANKYEDKSELLHRLLRYDVLCKVLRPLSYAQEMKTLIQKSLDNYNN